MEESSEIVLESDLPPIGTWGSLDSLEWNEFDVTFLPDGSGTYDDDFGTFHKFTWENLEVGLLRITHEIDEKFGEIEPQVKDVKYQYMLIDGDRLQACMRCESEPFGGTALSLSEDLQRLFAANWPKVITKEDRWCSRNIAIESGKFYEPKRRVELLRDAWDTFRGRPIRTRVYKKSRVQSPREIQFCEELVGCSVIGCGLTVMVGLTVFSYLVLAGRIMNERLVDQIWARGVAILYFLFLAWLLWGAVSDRRTK